jgi:hypothetical protein
MSLRATRFAFKPSLVKECAKTHRTGDGGGLFPP